MALVTVQRSPSPSQSGTELDDVDVPSHSDVSRASGRQKRSRATSLVKRCINSMRFISRIRFSESYFTVKGAALILPNAEACKRKISKASHGGDIQNHLQAMCHLLRPQDTLQVAVKLESVYAHSASRYFAVVSCNGRQDTEESVVLGLDCGDESRNACVGLVLPVWANTRTSLNGDGGFTICTANERTHIFKPVTVQAMWSGLHVLHKVCDNANSCCYVPSGLTHTWISYYESKMEFADPLAIGEWNMTDELIAAVKCGEGSSIRPSAVSGQEDLEKQIRTKLREIMIRMDLDDVTSVYLRQQLEAALHVNLKSYKSFIDEEMIVVMGQLDSPSRIFDFLYLGSEWNASNLEELQENGIGYILNVTKEIDNFFPGLFKYHNVRVHDTEDTDLLRHWEATHKFILRAIDASSKVLVHCKMGVSRSASTVIAFAMKQFNWSFDKAHQYVLARRSVVRPNDGFRHQLQLYEGILKASNQRHSELWRSKSESNLKAIQRSSSLQTVGSNQCGSGSCTAAAGTGDERRCDGCDAGRRLVLEMIGSTTGDHDRHDEMAASSVQADLLPAPAAAGTVRPRSWSSCSVDKEHERLAGVKSASCLQELESNFGEAERQDSSANSQCSSSCGSSVANDGDTSSAFSDGEVDTMHSRGQRQCYDLTSLSSAVTTASDALAAAASPAADDDCFAKGAIHPADSVCRETHPDASPMLLQTSCDRYAGSVVPGTAVACSSPADSPAIQRWNSHRFSLDSADRAKDGTAFVPSTLLAAQPGAVLPVAAVATSGDVFDPMRTLPSVAGNGEAPSALLSFVPECGSQHAPSSRQASSLACRMGAEMAAAAQPHYSPADVATASLGVHQCGEDRGKDGGQVATGRPTCLDGPWRRWYAQESIPWSPGAVRRQKDVLECGKTRPAASEAVAGEKNVCAAASGHGPAVLEHVTATDTAAGAASSCHDLRCHDSYSAATCGIDDGQPTPGTVKKVRREFEERLFADELGVSLATRGCTVHRSSSLKGLTQLPGASSSPTSVLQRSSSVRERRSAACLYKGGGADDGRGSTPSSPLSRLAASSGVIVSPSMSVQSPVGKSSASRMDMREGRTVCRSEAVPVNTAELVAAPVTGRASSVSPVASGAYSSSEDVTFFLGAAELNKRQELDGLRLGDGSKLQVCIQGSAVGAISLRAPTEKVEQHRGILNDSSAVVRVDPGPVKLRAQAQSIIAQHFGDDRLCTPTGSDVCGVGYMHLCGTAQCGDDGLSQSRLRQTSSVKNLVDIFEAGWRNTWSGGGKEDSSFSVRPATAVGCPSSLGIQASPLYRARSFCVRHFARAGNSQAVPAEDASADRVRLRSKHSFTQRHRISSAGGADQPLRSTHTDAKDGRPGFVPSRNASLHIVAQ